MTQRLQFRLRSLFWLLAVVAVGCLVVPRLIADYRERVRKERARQQLQETLKYWDSPSTGATPVR